MRLYSCIKHMECPWARPLHRMKLIRGVGGFREDLSGGQEYDLHLRLACAGAHFRRVPGVMTRVRKMQGSVSSDPLNALSQYQQILMPAYDAL